MNKQQPQPATNSAFDLHAILCKHSADTGDGVLISYENLHAFLEEATSRNVPKTQELGNEPQPATGGEEEILKFVRENYHRLPDNIHELVEVIKRYAAPLLYRIAKLEKQSEEWVPLRTAQYAKRELSKAQQRIAELEAENKGMGETKNI